MQRLKAPPRSFNRWATTKPSADAESWQSSYLRCADEADAVQAADFPGKKQIVKRSWGFSAANGTSIIPKLREHKIKPHKPRSRRDHECVLVNCERCFRLSMTFI